MCVCWVSSSMDERMTNDACSSTCCRHVIVYNIWTWVPYIFIEVTQGLGGRNGIQFRLMGSNSLIFAIILCKITHVLWYWCYLIWQHTQQICYCPYFNTIISVIRIHPLAESTFYIYWQPDTPRTYLIQIHVQAIFIPLIDYTFHSVWIVVCPSKICIRDRYVLIWKFIYAIHMHLCMYRNEKNI